MIVILHRKNAPISETAWQEIDERAEDVIKSYLSARKVLHVVGPKGIDYTVVPEGRLGDLKSYNDQVRYGTYQVKPLIEGRVEFKLNRFELDNLERGAKDIDLEPLEEAVKQMALFEENVIYNGLEKGSVNGLLNDVKKETITLSKKPEEMMDAISEGVIKLKEAYINTPISFVVGKEVFKLINRNVNGTKLIKDIEALLGTKVIYSHVLDGALLIPYDHDDLEMVIGQDFTIGYQGDDTESVKFFITESFTQRTLDPEILIKFKI